MTRTTVRRSALVGMCITAAAFLAVGMGDVQPTTDYVEVVAKAESLRSEVIFNNIDVNFAQAMLCQQRYAAKMAELATSRAVDPHVRQLAARIGAAYGSEVRVMTAWLDSWGRSAASLDSRLEKTMEGELATLRSVRGSAFDRMFVRMMLSHHAGVLHMVKDEKTRGSSLDVKAWATALERKQATEAAQLQKVLDQLPL